MEIPHPAACLRTGGGRASRGLRVQKNDLQYVYDGDTIILDVNGNGALVTRYLYGHQLIKQYRSNTIHSYYSYNGHGDTVRIMDASGAFTLAQYDYDAFGKVLSKSEPGGSNTYLYAGYQYDTEMEQYYLRARYYTPNTGRFISADPYWTPQNSIDKDNPSYNSVVQSNNLYVYCANNPIIYTDPSGLISVQAVADAIRYAITSEMKSAIRAAWKALGVNLVLKEHFNYLSAAWMMEHSLQDNPSKMIRYNDSNIAGLVRNSPQFKNITKDVVREAERDSKIAISNIYKSTALRKSQEIFFAINKCDLYYSGTKDGNTWYLDCKLTDVFDFTEINKVIHNNMPSDLKDLLYDVGGNVAKSSKVGAVVPFDVEIHVKTEVTV